MKLTIKDLKGNSQGELEVKTVLIENMRGTQAVHEAVVAYRAAQRSGTACTKTVGEVSGSNKKPWRQKGTGRARAGSNQSPLWPGGGVVFGPKPRDYSKKVGRASKQLALVKAWSDRVISGDVVVVDDLKLSSPKTKDFVAVLKALEVGGTAIVVDADGDKNLLLAARNIDRVEVTTCENLNTYQLLRPSKLVFSRTALEKFEQRINKA